jgi:hypothetical protein
MKTLKFENPGLILNGEKNTTWRINDEKNLSVGDGISLCGKNGKEFSKAKIISVKEKMFKELKPEDVEGHEKFSSEEEMYKTYSRYYKIEVGPKTKLKVIKFQVIK